MNKQEITSKWNKTGMLDGLSNNDKDDVSTLLEELALYLIARTSGKELTSFDYFFNCTILPILRRLYVELSKGKPTPNVVWLINDYERYITENKLFPLNPPEMDTEYEICCDYVERVKKMDYFSY